VFSAEYFQISTLFIDVNDIVNEYILMIAQLLAPYLSFLDISFDGNEDDPLVCYDILEIFLSRCQGVRNLRLKWFSIGNDPSVMIPLIKEGFSRLNQLALFNSAGNVILFIESTPIPALLSLRIEFNDAFDRMIEEGSDILNAVALNYRTLLNLTCLVSSANIFKIAECCSGLVSLTISFKDEWLLSLSDAKVIASFPRLKYPEDRR
jgi:hypothetical protein